MAAAALKSGSEFVSFKELTVFVSDFESRKFVAILIAFLACLVPIMEASMLAPSVSYPTSVVPFGPGASDFTISFSSDTMTLAAGAGGSTGVILTSVGGFSGLILLSTSTFFLDASLDKQNVTLSPSGSASATLTVVVPITTTPGNYTISVNGAYGCNTLHTKDITVNVTGPDFTISSSKPVLSMTPGGVDSSLITLTSVTGFSGLVSLFAYPSGGLGPSLSPASVPVPSGGAVSSNLTVFAPPSTLPGNYTVVLVANSGSLVQSLDVLVTVIGPGLTASASQFFLKVAVGGSNSSVITVKPFGGLTGLVTFYNSSSPPGLEAVFAPPSVSLPGPGTSTLTVSAPPDTSLGFHDLTIVAFSPTFNATIYMTVFVGPDFSISASPEEVSLIAGGSSCTSTVTVTALDGFTGLVTLANSTFPAALTVTISTTSITTSGTATLTISAPASTVPGFYYIEIDANSTSTLHITSVIVNVTGPDFAISASPSSILIDAPLTGNTNKNSTVTITSLLGFSGTVSLTAFVAGANMTATVSPVDVTSPGTATLTVAVGNESISGVYGAIIVGTSDSLTHTVIVSVTVVAPDFSINASPTTISIDTFTPGTSTITITPLNGFTATVDLFIYAPLEVNATVTPTSITGSDTATLSVNSTVPGTYTVEVDGFSRFLFHPTFVSVTVAGPDFSITSSPATLPVPAGSNANSTINVAGLNGFTGSADLTAIASVGLSTSLNVSSITPSTTAKLTITLAPDTPAGTYYVDVVGTSGALTHATIVTVQVSDFTLSASPSSLTISPSISGSSTITLTGLNGFIGTVALSVSPSTPSGLTCSLPSTVVFGTSPQAKTLSCSANTTGNYTVTVQGVSGSLAHNALVNVTVTGSSTGSSVLGLPSTTFYGIIIVLVIPAVGVALYLRRFRKKEPGSRPTRQRSKS